MSKPTLGYWDVRAYGQTIRCMLAYLGVDYEEKRYKDFKERSDWLADKFSLGLEFPNIPYWIDGDVRLTETKAILKHIARGRGQAKNLLPTDPFSASQMDMLENVISDVWTMLFNACYGNTKADIDTLNSDGALKFQWISKYLGSKKFLLGDQLTYVDFMLHEILFFGTAYGAEFLKPLTNLADYKKRFEAIPEIEAYSKSPNYIASGCTSPYASHPVL